MEDLKSLDGWCGQWAIKFSAAKSAVLAYSCYVHPDRLLINGFPMPTIQCTKDLGLQCSCSFNFHEQAACQMANAKRTSGFIVETFRTLRCELVLYKQHCRQRLDYCPIILSDMLRVDRVEIEKYKRIHRDASWSDINLSCRNDANCYALTPFGCVVSSWTLHFFSSP